jgi:hypothetical protein
MAVEDNGEVRISAQMLQALLPAMQSLNITPPDASKIVPTIDMAAPIRDLAIQVGQLLRNCGLYRYGPTGQLRAKKLDKFEQMTPIWFCSWIEKHLKVVKTYKSAGGGTYDAAVSLGKDVAAKLLESEELQRELPLLSAVLRVRVPVQRKAGHAELCEVGYDAEAGVYCTDDVTYDLDWDLQKAADVIEKKYCKEFPWAEKGESLWTNRSFLVHVASMLGVYMRRLLPAGTVRPLIFYMANDQGSGKSLLVSMVLGPCFGMAASTDLPLGTKGVNPEKFTALLETVAQSNKEFLWLDDVPQNVWSNALNRFITAPAHEGRKYGGNSEMFEALNVTQVFMTGNMPEATRDLMQRALVCELFLSQASETVDHEHEMTPTWLADPAQRSELLSAMWAMVRTWIESGRPLSKTRQSRAPVWSRMVGGVLRACGVSADPFALPDLPVGGDRESEEWKQLLVALADAAEDWVEDKRDKSYEINTTGIVDEARKLKLLVDLVGGDDDKPLKGGELKKLGKRLAKWRGKTDLRTTKGRRFEFGKRKQSSNWVYPITWLDPWPEPDDGDDAEGSL